MVHYPDGHGRKSAGHICTVRTTEFPLWDYSKLLCWSRSCCHSARVTVSPVMQRWASSRNARYDKNASNHQCAAHGQQTQGQPDTDAHAKTCISTDGWSQVCTHTHTHTHVCTCTQTLCSPSRIVFHPPTELQLKSLVWSTSPIIISPPLSRSFVSHWLWLILLWITMVYMVAKLIFPLKLVKVWASRAASWPLNPLQTSTIFSRHFYHFSSIGSLKAPVHK